MSESTPDANADGTNADNANADDATERDRDELVARLELLEAENTRLREEYTRARQTQYRRTAVALGGVGVAALAASVLFEGERTILLALGSIGVFAGVLTFYLTPEHVIPASVGERIYDSLSANHHDIVTELGLHDDHTYVPVDDGTTRVRLFIPQHREYDLPDETHLDHVFVIPDDESERGIAVRPTGQRLFEAFENALAGELATEPVTLADQLSDGLVEQFELATAAEVDANPAEGRVSIGITESTYGSIARFDHPIPSFIAVGVATGLDEAVTLNVDADEEQTNGVVTCTWSTTD